MTRKILLASLLWVFVIQAEVIYKVRLTSNDGGHVVSLPAEQYVAAVLAGESGTFRSDEALKAMAVAARTYAARLRGRHAAEGYDFCGTTHCQRAEPGVVTSRLLVATRATAGELLWYEGRPAFTVYARDCGGKSEGVGAVWPDVQAPYLRVQADPYCLRHGAASWLWNAGADAIARALLDSQLRVPQPLRRVTVLNRSPSGRARTLQLIGDPQTVAISASSFRFALGRALGWNTLRSEQYEIQNRNGQIFFRGRGEGHGVGLCQYGADEMGNEGSTYREILAFYYPGTTVGLTAKGIQWTWLGGERINLFTTLPGRDADVLTIAESLQEQMEGRLGWKAKDPINIRIYPDLDTFRNATGEPGWVAARSSRSGIDLQPPSVLKAHGALRSTLRHEITHVLIEREAHPDLPVWFREGLVEWLCSERRGERSGRLMENNDLRQRGDSARAGQAYALAYQQVADLMNRYGEGTVLGWVRRGLPLAVRNSMVSKAATNSK
ncbi:MAG: SpoIID/LytB domain-containing protein [Acidobacteriaceae bacterium]|nr:SpoIID/LytB domain-containing protein [Acidobacteriaceae bacterium]